MFQVSYLIFPKKLGFVELIFVGPAHTTNDVIAWIPERKLLFSGDVIFNGGTPFALFGSIVGRR